MAEASTAATKQRLQNRFIGTSDKWTNRNCWNLVFKLNVVAELYTEPGTAGNCELDTSGLHARTPAELRSRRRSRPQDRQGGRVIYSSIYSCRPPCTFLTRC